MIQIVIFECDIIFRNKNYGAKENIVTDIWTINLYEKCTELIYNIKLDNTITILSHHLCCNIDHGQE